MRLLYYMLQIFWLKVGRQIFFRFYLKRFAELPNGSVGDIYARGKRDYSYYANFVDLAGKSLLDVGCGLGRKTVFYSIKGAKATGVDIDRQAVKEAHHFIKENKIQEIDFVVADAARLPFSECSFDVVISNDSLEHISMWREAIFEMKRVMKSNGFLCINFGPLWCSPFGSHMDFGEFFSPPWGHLIFSEKTIKAVLISFGKIAQADRNKPLFMHHLNRIKVKDFEEFLKIVKMKIILYRTRSVPPFEIFQHTPLREFFATQVITLLQKI